MNGTVLLSTAYFPDLNYLSQLVNAGTVIFEKHEHFIKQTYRNRCNIATTNGKLSLSIPLVKQADKELISEKRIAYAENWQQQHWRTITSAYKNSPYFEFFEDEFRPFYENKCEFLFDYNFQIIQCVLKILRVKQDISFTSEFLLTPEGINDQRQLSMLKHFTGAPVKPYYQVFADKTGFIPGLSCMDAIFNVGLGTKELLVK